MGIMVVMVITEDMDMGLNPGISKNQPKRNLYPRICKYSGGGINGLPSRIYLKLVVGTFLLGLSIRI